MVALIFEKEEYVEKVTIVHIRMTSVLTSTMPVCVVVVLVAVVLIVRLTTVHRVHRKLINRTEQ